MLKLDERVEVSTADLLDGSGVFYNFDPGLKVTVRDLITQMIIASDNTATDLVLARVGGIEAINVWLRDKGFNDTRMILSMSDSFRVPLILQNEKYRSLTAEQVYAYWMYPYHINPVQLQRQAALAAPLRKELPFADVVSRIAPLWNDDPTYWLGSMTARGTSRLLEAIEKATITSKNSSAEMKRILVWQRLGQLRIPHYLPMEADVAHKTGDGPPVIANDVGIVYAPKGPFVISFFSAAINEPYAEHEDRIGRLARRVYDYFEQQP